MKQPEDTKTLDLIDTQKRGRGRPAVAHPLSQAERAKIYRLRKKSKESVSAPGHLKGDVAAMTPSQTENLRVALDNANEQIRELQVKLNSVIKSDVTKNEIFKLSDKLKLSESNVDAEREFARQWFETAKKAEKELKMEKERSHLLQKENDLLVAERGAAWKAVELLKRDASQKHESDLSVTHHENSFASAYMRGFNAGSDADNPFIFSDPSYEVWWSGRRERAFLDCKVNK